MAAESNVGVKIVANVGQFVENIRRSTRAVKVMTKAVTLLGTALGLLAKIPGKRLLGLFAGALAALQAVKLAQAFDRAAQSMIKMAEAGERVYAIRNLRIYNDELRKLEFTLGGVKRLFKELVVGNIFAPIAGSILQYYNNQFTLLRHMLQVLFPAPVQTQTFRSGSNPSQSGFGAAGFTSAPFMTVLVQSVRSIDQQVKKIGSV